MKIATTCPHCASTEQYGYNSPNQQRSQTCKKCRKSYKVAGKKTSNCSSLEIIE